MKEIEFKVDIFDLQSVRKAVKHAKSLKPDMDDAIDSAITEIQSRVRKRLLVELARYNLADSELASSIEFINVHQGFIVTVGTDHAMFVEFGTGLIGEESPHPDPSFDGADWEVNASGHGEEGWWYPTVESDPNLKKYFSKSKGIWIAWTAGSEAKPFMYNTWRYSRNISAKIINKHLSEVGK